MGARTAQYGAMKTIRLMALLSIVMTMALVAMDTANASSIVHSKSGDVGAAGSTGTAQRMARGAADPDWGPRQRARVR